MLRDLYFYPLAALFVLGMVAFALSFGGGEDVDEDYIVRTGWTMEGEALRNLTVSPGSNMDYVDDEGGYARLSVFTPFGVGPASIGVFATLGPDHEDAFAGRLLTITVRARASDRDPLESFDSAYFTLEGPQSPWREFTLDRDWQDYTYQFTPPIIDAEPNVDFLAIFAGRAGEQKQMDLASLRIEVKG